MALSLYSVPVVYRLAMRLAYGAEYGERHRLVAQAVGEPSDVLEVCCGDLALHDHLRAAGLLTTYTGVDVAPAMLVRARRRGVDVRALDLRRLERLPSASIVVMQASLYQFHDIAERVLDMLWAAATRRLVVAEPVRNVTHSRVALLRWLARVATRTDHGEHPFRYDEVSLLALYRGCRVPVTDVRRTSRGREVVVVSERS